MKENETTGKYFEEYDAYYNFREGTWTEEKCKDKTCEYCKNRPDKLK